MENRRDEAPNASRAYDNERSRRENAETSRSTRSNRVSNNRVSGSSTAYSRKNGQFDRSQTNPYQAKKRFKRKPRPKDSIKSDALPPIVSDKQVTDGKHRGKYISLPDSPKFRPSTRKLREALFRIIYRQVKAGRFLDLCAGSGMVGIEAISRGAMISTFVERSAKMCSLIRKNLEHCSIKSGHGEVFELEVVPFLKRMIKRKRLWDVAYYDPPFNAEYDDVLRFFESGAVVRRRGILVIEHHQEMFFPEKIGVMNRWKVVVQGDSAISLYDRKS